MAYQAPRHRHAVVPFLRWAQAGERLVELGTEGNLKPTPA